MKILEKSCCVFSSHKLVLRRQPTLTEQNKKNMKTSAFTLIQRSFAADLVKLPEWKGPSSFVDFDIDDWYCFAKWMREEDESGSLTQDDIDLCNEIADVIMSEL